MLTWYDGISEAWKNDIRFLQIISELSGLPIALWFPGEQEEKFRWTSSKSAEHPCFSDDALRTSLEQVCRNGEPSIYYETEQIFYGVMPIGPFRLAIGPAAKNTVQDETIVKYATDHGMEAPIPIGKIDWETMSRYLKLMYCHFMGSTVPQEEIPVHHSVWGKWTPVGDLEEYQLDQSENDRDHYIGMDFEQRILQAIKEGDTVSLKALMAGPAPDFKEIGNIANEQSKETEYLTVALVTLMTRAAVEGGILPEVAHEMGDVCLRKIAKATERGESIQSLTHSALIEFAEAVKRNKREKSDFSYVEMCKSYIEKNLRKDIRVGDIAPAIGLSRTYLSRLFSQAEGITVQQYIQKEKCRHAARMLQYTDYSISRIAQYFGFSSQSYFGSCFQTWYKMTPNDYRKANHEGFAHH